MSSLQLSLALTESSMALLVATLTGGASLAQPLLGALADRVGRQLLTGLGAILAAAAISLVGVASSATTLLLLLVGGLGSAALHPAGASVARDSVLIGWTLATFSLAAAVGGIIAGLLAARDGRRLLVAGTTLLVPLPLFALFQLEPGGPAYFLMAGLGGALVNAGLPLKIVAAQELAPRSGRARMARSGTSSCARWWREDWEGSNWSSATPTRG